MSDFHFLRPWWLITIIPLTLLLILLWRQASTSQAWAAVCDSHLLKHLVHTKGQNRRHYALLLLFFSGLFMILGLTGPCWQRLPVPSYQQIQPRVLVLDMSTNMLMHDLSPDRLSRAKFKLHDLFKRRDIGQFGLVVYSGEPFVVSPLTDDAHTIDTLLSSLSPSILPVTGQRLDSALEEAGQLISNAGFKHGQVLVLTGEVPSLAAIETAKKLAHKQIATSVIPMLGSKSPNPLFQELAQAGKGQLLNFSDTSDDLDQWLKVSINDMQFSQSKDNDIPLWRDEGRWFLLAALLFLLPAFRRGWLQRITA